MLPIGVTESQISAWKKKHGKIFIISVETDESVDAKGKVEYKEVHAIFKQPDMDIISAMTKKVKTDEIQASNFLYNSCLLVSDPEIDDDISLKMSVMGELKGLVEKKKANLKRL